MSKILVIEDDSVLCRILLNWLEKKKLAVECAYSVAEAKKKIEVTDADVILSDMRLPDGDGITILEWMNEKQYHIPFILMTQYADVLSAVRAMKLGAEDYLPKPILPEKLFATLNGLLHRKLSMSGKSKTLFRRESKLVQEAERRAKLVATTDMSVLIRGENGTGKEHIAHLIHETSSRAGKPFVAIDSGAVPKELAASEFFGYTKGAFTGATENKSGVFHQAEGGSLFLDEIGNLPYEIQVLLLRTLQEKCYRPVGAKQELKCDVRIIAATNENIEKAIEGGRFREDLYHRLNEFTIVVPPLRKCREDILPLAEFFRERCCSEFGKKVFRFDTEANKLLQAYGWPGNIRELQHCIRSAVLLTEDDDIGTKDLDINSLTTNVNYSLKVENEEREHIIKALESAQNNKTLAANMLNISRPTLYEKIKKYGIG
jgi:two-component system, NtrC family, response regulator HydG